jgi:hypothetical protein
MKASVHRLRQVEPEGFYTTGQSDEFARLTQETERLAQHVQELRLRIAATARRRASSECHAVQDDRAAGEALSSSTTSEQPSRVAPANERESCLASVSRWLPPLAPPPVAGSGQVAKNEEAGRYSVVIPRCPRRDASEEIAPHGKLKVPA